MDPIIVIGRQYGAGGRKIGRELARRFGIPYYDRELLSEAAVRLGMSRDLFDRTDEQPPSVLRSLFGMAYGSADSFGSSPVSREGLYAAQSHVISQLAAEGGAVFVGRTADYVLRRSTAMVSLFLHAPEEARAARLMERGEADRTDRAIEMLRRADSGRRGYYNYFTGRKWGDAANYDLTFDSSRLTAEQTADFLEGYVRAVLASGIRR